MKTWKPGEEVKAEGLNQTSNFIPWLVSWVYDNAREARTSSFALLNNGLTLVCRDYSTSTNLNFFSRPNQSFPFTPVSSAITITTILPTNQLRVTVSGVEKLLLKPAHADHTEFYIVDADGANQTQITFSGTTLVDCPHRWGFDTRTGYIYISDGAGLGDTALKRFTISGTTLTYVDTITLGEAPNNGGAAIMVISDTYLFMSDNSTGGSERFRAYNKTTGALVETISYAYQLGGANLVMCPDPEASQYGWVCMDYTNIEGSSPSSALVLHRLSYEP